MSTEFKPLTIPPGVTTMPTKKVRSSNWAEVNLVRWIQGKLAPIGPQSLGAYSFASRCKKIVGWYGLDTTYRIAYLCEQHLYVDVGGLLFDITPINETGERILPPIRPLRVGGYGDGLYGAGTYGTPRPTTEDTAVDKIPAAFSLDNFGAILFAMTSPDGRLLAWDPSLGAVTGAATLSATATFTTGSANITMPTNPGTVFPGMSVYDVTTSQMLGTVKTYVGTALVLTANALHASSGAADSLRFDNIAAEVTPETGLSVPNIVPRGRCFVVTQERFIMVFGSHADGSDGVGPPPLGGGFRRFAWCEQENYRDWSYSSVVSQAGFLDVEPSSPIMSAIATKTGVIFWTAKKVYRSRFLGLPYVFNCEELGDDCAPWSPQSMVTTSSMMLWMAEQGVYSYDGTSVLPVTCPIKPWIDADIDLVNVKQEGAAVHVASFNEFWWFFPQKGQPWNTRVGIFGYREGWWSQGTMARSAGITSSYTAHTIMADGQLPITHEVIGATRPDYVHADLPWAETFNLNLGAGARLTTLKQMIPDIDILAIRDGDFGRIGFSLYTRMSRSNGDAEQLIGPMTIRDNGYVDFRTTARDIRLRITVTDAPLPNFTLGEAQVDAVTRGDR